MAAAVCLNSPLCLASTAISTQRFFVTLFLWASLGQQLLLRQGLVGAENIADVDEAANSAGLMGAGGGQKCVAMGG